jgi:hypothetical protein
LPAPLVKLKAMKKLILTCSLLGLAGLGLATTPVRNLKTHPLTPQEEKAFRSAQSLASEMGITLSPFCINADFGPGHLPVMLQFSSADQSPGCQDPHFALEVNFNDDRQVSSIHLIDN